MSPVMAPAGFEAAGVPAVFFPHLDPANDGHAAWTYLLHLEPAYKQAAHYLGSASGLAARLRQHGTCDGARLLQVQREAGGSFVLARTWPGGRAVETHLKAQKQGTRLCPLCCPATRRGALPAALEPAVPLVPLSEVSRPRPVLASRAAAGRRWARRFLADREGWTADEIEADAALIQSPYYQGDRRTPERDAEQGAFAAVVTAALDALRASVVAGVAS
jgi:hypothetical protein